MANPNGLFQLQQYNSSQSTSSSSSASSFSSLLSSSSSKTLPLSQDITAEDVPEDLEVIDEWKEDILTSPVSEQSGAGGRRVSFCPKLRGTAFKNHLRDVEFYPDSPTSDLLEFLLAAEPIVTEEIQEQLEVHRGVKCWMILKVQYK